MRKKAAFTLFIWVSTLFGFRAQTLNTARQVGMQTTDGMVRVGSKNFYLEKTISEEFWKSDQIEIVGLNNAGAEIFRRLVFAGPYAGAVGLSVVGDATLLVNCLTPRKKCEFSEYESVIAKFDTTTRQCSSNKKCPRFNSVR